jgi:hypothetical protein
VASSAVRGRRGDLRSAAARLRLALYELLEDEDGPPRGRRVVQRLLVAAILLSVAGGVLDTVDPVRERWGVWLATVEGVCFALFPV